MYLVTFHYWFLTTSTGLVHFWWSSWGFRDAPGPCDACRLITGCVSVLRPDPGSAGSTGANSTLNVNTHRLQTDSSSIFFFFLWSSASSGFRASGRSSPSGPSAAAGGPRPQTRRFLRDQIRLTVQLAAPRPGRNTQLPPPHLLLFLLYLLFFVWFIVGHRMCMSPPAAWEESGQPVFRQLTVLVLLCLRATADLKEAVRTQKSWFSETENVPLTVWNLKKIFFKHPSCFWKANITEDIKYYIFYIFYIWRKIFCDQSGTVSITTSWGSSFEMLWDVTFGWMWANSEAPNMSEFILAHFCSQIINNYRWPSFIGCHLPMK